MSVEGCCKVLKGALEDARDKACCWTNGPAMYRDTQWWNDDANNIVSEKCIN